MSQVEVTFINRKPRMFVVCGVRMLPGKHSQEISEERLQQVTQSDQFRSWQQLGWVAIRGLPGTTSAPAPTAPTAPTAPIDLTKVEPVEPTEDEDAKPPEDALRGVTLPTVEAMVKGCEDIELLAAWHDRDKRLGAKKVIAERLEELDAFGPADGLPVGAEEE